MTRTTGEPRAVLHLSLSKRGDRIEREKNQEILHIINYSATSNPRNKMQVRRTCRQRIIFSGENDKGSLLKTFFAEYLRGGKHLEKEEEEKVERTSCFIIQM